MGLTNPNIWLIVGDKLGDNAQLEVLAQEIGCPIRRKTLQFKEKWVYGKPRFRASLHHIDLSRSDRLEPPWPDLVITIGRRPAMAALWVKRQSLGTTKVALVGRPKRYFDHFDLIITTGQYSMPDRPNVLKLDLPLMRAAPDKVDQATARWFNLLAEMPRPLTAVFIGGATKPFRFGPDDAIRLIRQVELATDNRGSLYISTSRRTSSAATEALAANLPPNARLFRWSENTPSNENPYLALLGLADRFVVTGDSLSMLVEVARMGKPLTIAPLPLNKQVSLLSFIAHGKSRHEDYPTGLANIRYRLLQAAQRIGLLNSPRDFSAVHRTLIRQNAAEYLGKGFSAPLRPVRDDATVAVEALHRLLGTQHKNGG